jgi:hypothetical protein
LFVCSVARLEGDRLDRVDARVQRCRLCGGDRIAAGTRIGAERADFGVADGGGRWRGVGGTRALLRLGLRSHGRLQLRPSDAITGSVRPRAH